ncbi:hypothetical protein TNCV_1072751 [Trichonephila clavipes]|nr:hypothetical protein TNCV_1072751 [Trichonephila clavipes]
MMHPLCLLMPLETPSDFSGTNFDRKEFPLLDLTVGKSWSCLLDGQRRAQLSALPMVEGVACFRVHRT